MGQTAAHPEVKKSSKSAGTWFMNSFLAYLVLFLRIVTADSADLCSHLSFTADHM